ncbi:unnamed protein product [Paramecium sonneborni]|uniref:WDR36/Utp21 C-terminal domain-containing protein n=1 Tax=Paramecium sonneborni TaxID=65129 RepID=A0A8S1K1B5_9CILI|nr:unnamed protein product [Paramecium sonneborni]
MIKTLSPSSYNYELRCFLIGKPQNQIQIFRILEERLQNTTDLDLKVTYLMRFKKYLERIQIHNVLRIKKTFKNIIENLEQQWQSLDDIKSYIECVIDYYKTII